MSEVLVTGSSGFIGSHLVDALIDRAVRVVESGRFASASSVNRATTRSLLFDLERAHELRASDLVGIDCIYHLAAHVHVMRGRPDEERFHSMNAHATQLLAQRAAEARVRRFVFLSSIKVNGERTIERAFTRDDPAAPQDAYGRSKLEAERALARIAETSDLEVVIVRPPLVYGPGVGANFRSLMSITQRGWPLPFASIDNSRSLVSTWNLVSFLILAGTSRAASGRIWLVSDGEDVSTPRLVCLISRGLGRAHARLLRLPVWVLRTLGTVSGRSSEVARLVESLQVDISVTQSELGWRPDLSLSEGIRRTTSWFSEQRGENV